MSTRTGAAPSRRTRGGAKPVLRTRGGEFADAPPPLDAPTNADVGYEYDSLVHGSFSLLWYVHPVLRATAPNLTELVGTDAAFSTPGTTHPVGVKGGQSYLINNTRTSSTTARVGMELVAPVGTTALRFEVGARKWSVDAATTERVVLAVYEADGTTLLGSQVVTLGAAAMYTLTVPVSGGGRYLVVVWFNNPSLGTLGGAGTSARGYFSRCRVVPTGSLMGVFASHWWRVERVPWDADAGHATLAPGPRGWGADPGPTGFTDGTTDRVTTERTAGAPFALRVRGRHAAVLYCLQTGGGSDARAWGTAFYRTAPVTMTADRDMSAPTLLPVPADTSRSLAQVTLDDASERLLLLQSPQAGRVLAAYVGAYAGTAIEPPPAFPKVLWWSGDSIDEGYQFRADHAPWEQFRAHFNGHVVAHNFGGSALLSYGYVGNGAGALDPSPSAVAARAAYRALRLGLNVTPTQLGTGLGTNDWGGAGISKADYAVGVSGWVADSHSDFPAAPLYLRQVLGRAGQGTPVAPGNATLVPDYRDVAVAEAAAHPSYVTTREFEQGAPYPKGDGTHLNDAANSNDLFAAAYAAWLAP